MHCHLHWGGVLRNRQYVHSLLSQCFVSCGSTNHTALWVTGYLGDLSAILVVDKLQRQAVDRRCCKRPSRLRNWSVLHTPHVHLSNRIWTYHSSSSQAFIALKRPFSRVIHSPHPRHTACLLSQFNNWQRQSLQPTAGVSSNILNNSMAYCCVVYREKLCND